MGLACVREGGTSVHRLKKDHSTKTTHILVLLVKTKIEKQTKQQQQQQQQQVILEVKVYSIPETFVFQIEIRTLKACGWSKVMTYDQ